MNWKIYIALFLAAAAGYFARGYADREHPTSAVSEQSGAPNNIVVAGRFQKYDRGYLFDTATGRVCVPAASLDSTIIIGEQSDKAMDDFKKGDVDSCTTEASFYAVKITTQDAVPLLLRKAEQASK